MGSEVSAVSSDLPLLRGTWRLRTHPQAGNGSGAVGLVREEPGPPKVRQVAQIARVRDCTDVPYKLPSNAEFETSYAVFKAS